MIYFQCDYAEGYGTDPHCRNAENLIRKAVGCPDARVYFTVGGTQTNQVVIASLLKPHQGVVSADTGHINVHETGAIEATGHKVLAIPHENGKIPAEKLEAYLQNFRADDTFEHIVEPGMVYISSPTELGTLYSKAELEALSRICREFGIPLFLDGARLGYGLAAADNDVTLPDIVSLCDVFYIGGTKCGALFGEAVVFSGDKTLDRHFRPIMKQHGAMLAKGRLLGIQFETLFSDDLYTRITRDAVTRAIRIKEAFLAKGCEFLIDSSTNQQFPILSKKQIAKLSEKFAFTMNLLS